MIYLFEPRSVGNLSGLVRFPPAKMVKLSGTKALYAVGISTESTEAGYTAVTTKNDVHAGVLLYYT